MIKIRRVQEADIIQLLNIYKPYIQTPITFEYEEPSLEEFKQRVSTITTQYPYLVCEREGKVLGYAYANRHRERAAYQWDVELSIYVDQECNSRGIGKALYYAVMEVLTLQNIKTAYGAVTRPNLKSEGLHQFFGFKLLGVFHNTGYKCGAWHDVMWFEKQLGEYEEIPKAFISIQDIEDQSIKGICEESKKYIK